MWSATACILLKVLDTTPNLLHALSGAKLRGKIYISTKMQLQHATLHKVQRLNVVVWQDNAYIYIVRVAVASNMFTTLKLINSMGVGLACVCWSFIYLASNARRVLLMLGVILQLY